MKKRSSNSFDLATLHSKGNVTCKLRPSYAIRNGETFRGAPGVIAVLLFLAVSAVAREASSQHSDGIAIHGAVLDSAGGVVADAVVRLEQTGVPGAVETRSNSAGVFSFSGLRAGTYALSAEKSGLRSHVTSVTASSAQPQEQVNLVLVTSGKDSGAVIGDSGAPSSSSTQSMEFADKPNFAVAGVTDWTAAGGHGSDTSLRASEALTRETLKLKAEGQGDSAVDLAGGARKNADLHRVAAELDEKQGDPLAAVHEFEQAVDLDPSEQNYFEWGSELLLHRAVWQAQEIFQKGAEAYPKSARMLTALGTALFAGARYDEAALRVCDASDLNPADPEPYIFMGKIEMAAPNPLPCVEQKLARFVELQPDNSLANYLYAMAIWKGQEQPAVQQVFQRVEALLTKAVRIDDKCADAYLQLGNLYSSQHSFEKAIGFYSEAIEASPQLAEAHYRLGVAYDRTGEQEKAKQEFERHDEIKKLEAADVERQRREVKQFLVVVPGQQTYPTAH